MQTYIDNISFAQIIVYAVVGLILLLILNVVNIYVTPLIKDKRQKIYHWWQIIQIMVWIVYIGLFYSALFRLNMAITAVFTVVILGLGWNFWRNIFSGILIKFTNKIKKGDVISTEFASGELKKVNLSQSELINDQGELVVIPNLKLRSNVIKHLYKKSNVKTYSYLIRTADDQTVEDIYRMAYNCPYISANQDITVEKIKSNEFNIKAFIIDNSFVEKVNNYFENLKIR